MLNVSGTGGGVSTLVSGRKAESSCAKKINVFVISRVPGVFSRTPRPVGKLSSTKADAPFVSSETLAR